jgi:hypothetical protein
MLVTLNSLIELGVDDIHIVIMKNKYLHHTDKFL